MSSKNRREAKAARRDERARRDAASTVPVSRSGRPGPRADAIIKGLFASFKSGTPPRLCAHLDPSQPLDGPVHGYWAAGDPLMVRCQGCLETAAPVPDLCDYCGAAAPDPAGTVVDVGSTTARIVLCPSCLAADLAGKPLTGPPAPGPAE